MGERVFFRKGYLLGIGVEGGVSSIDEEVVERIVDVFFFFL